MTTPPAEQCACCGATTTTADRVDLTVPLPDGAVPSESTDPNAAFLRLESGQTFVRCQVPVALSGGTTLSYLTWLEVGEEDFRRAVQAWSDTSWADLILHGRLGSDLRPWVEALRGTEVMASVRAADEPPTVVNADHVLLRRMLTGTWDRDVVLSWFPDPLPVTIRTRVGAHWSVERGDGMAAALADGSWRFGKPGRAVFAEVVSDTGKRSPDLFLADLLSGAPEVPAERTSTERNADGITHSFWLETTAGGVVQHELHAHVVRPGTALSLGVVHSDPDDRRWALHVLRSVRHHA